MGLDIFGSSGTGKIDCTNTRNLNLLAARRFPSVFGEFQIAAPRRAFFAPPIDSGARMCWRESDPQAGTNRVHSMRVRTLGRNFHNSSLHPPHRTIYVAELLLVGERGTPQTSSEQHMALALAQNNFCRNSVLDGGKSKRETCNCNSPHTLSDNISVNHSLL